MNQEVDEYVKCAKQWQGEIESLRAILLGAKVEEHFKWKKPCYTFLESNIAIIQPFKTCLGLMFFKGALLEDPYGLLRDNGPHSQAARRLEFQSVAEITKAKSIIKAYIKEAMEIETSGRKVEFKVSPEPLPAELVDIFRKKPAVKKAFYALTPGRQRGYILHFTDAKQAATRTARIEKCLPRILDGKGLNDR